LDKNIVSSIMSIKDLITDANNAFEESMHYDGSEPDMIAGYSIERAFIQLLVLLETLDLENTYAFVSTAFEQARKEGFTKSAMGINEPYIVWGDFIYNYVDAIAVSHNVYKSEATVIKDIESILREALYSITDTKVFPSPPVNEAEVHSRIEAVLRCIFPDLKHGPTINKPIKSFVPDTGLPSIKTLIEYKFITNATEAKTIIDEILADTRGYVSKDWHLFLYVIYETRRLISEPRWNDLLDKCDLTGNTKIIVISGEPAETKGGFRRQKHESAAESSYST
jgi:hypothetical protein